MIKVLRIINRLNVGGPTYNVACLTKYISSEFETKVISGHKEPYEASSEYILNDLGIEPKYIQHMYRPINFIKDFKAYFEIRKIIKEYKPDIVHTHAAKAGMLGRIAAHHEQVPVIIHTFHGNVFDGYFGKIKSSIIKVIERYLSSVSTRIIAISSQQKKDLVHKYKIANDDKVEVIPLGFDLEKFSIDQPAKREQFRKQLNLQEHDIAIGIIGRLTSIKNHDLFFEAFSIAKKKYQSNLKAIIVGDGELREALLEKCTSLNLKACYGVASPSHDTDVIFTSWRKDIDIVNAGLDIVCLTSFNEGTPVCLIEALASGKPVISTKVGGVEDIIDDGVNGFLCEIDLNDFSQKLLTLLTNAEIREQFSRNSNKNVVQQFGYNRLVNDVETLYHKSLKKRNK